MPTYQLQYYTAVSEHSDSPSLLRGTSSDGTSNIERDNERKEGMSDTRFLLVVGVGERCARRRDDHYHRSRTGGSES